MKQFPRRDRKTVETIPSRTISPGEFRAMTITHYDNFPNQKIGIVRVVIVRGVARELPSPAMT